MADVEDGGAGSWPLHQDNLEDDNLILAFNNGGGGDGHASPHDDEPIALHEISDSNVMMMRDDVVNSSSTSISSTVIEASTSSSSPSVTVPIIVVVITVSCVIAAICLFVWACRLPSERKGKNLGEEEDVAIPTSPLSSKRSNSHRTSNHTHFPTQVQPHTIEMIQLENPQTSATTEDPLAVGKQKPDVSLSPLDEKKHPPPSSSWLWPAFNPLRKAASLPILPTHKSPRAASSSTNDFDLDSTDIPRLNVQRSDSFSFKSHARWVETTDPTTGSSRVSSWFTAPRTPEIDLAEVRLTDLAAVVGSSASAATPASVGLGMSSRDSPEIRDDMLEEEQQEPRMSPDLVQQRQVAETARASPDVIVDLRTDSALADIGSPGSKSDTGVTSGMESPPPASPSEGAEVEDREVVVDGASHALPDDDKEGDELPQHQHDDQNEGEAWVQVVHASEWDVSMVVNRDDAGDYKDQVLPEEVELPQFTTTTVAAPGKDLITLITPAPISNYGEIPQQLQQQQPWPSEDDDDVDSERPVRPGTPGLSKVGVTPEGEMVMDHNDDAASEELSEWEVETTFTPPQRWSLQQPKLPWDVLSQLQAHSIPAEASQLEQDLDHMMQEQWMSWRAELDESNAAAMLGEFAPSSVHQPFAHPDVMQSLMSGDYHDGSSEAISEESLSSLGDNSPYNPFRQASMLDLVEKYWSQFSATGIPLHPEELMEPGVMDPPVSFPWPSNLNCTDEQLSLPHDNMGNLLVTESIGLDQGDLEAGLNEVDLATRVNQEQQDHQVPDLVSDQEAFMNSMTQEAMMAINHHHHHQPPPPPTTISPHDAMLEFLLQQRQLMQQMRLQQIFSNQQQQQQLHQPMLAPSISVSSDSNTLARDYLNFAHNNNSNNNFPFNSCNNNVLSPFQQHQPQHHQQPPHHQGGGLTPPQWRSARDPSLLQSTRLAYNIRKARMQAAKTAPSHPSPLRQVSTLRQSRSVSSDVSMVSSTWTNTTSSAASASYVDAVSSPGGSSF